MSQLLQATWILFAAHLRRVLFSKRMLLSLLVCLAPVGCALLVEQICRAEQEPAPAFEIGWVLMVQGTVPLVALILGSAVVAEEIEDRTITYLFTRPIPRAAVLLGRWLATALVLEFCLLLSAELTFGLLQHSAAVIDFPVDRTMPEGMAERMRDVCLIGGLVYSALFAVAGACFKHPMIAGIGYTFVVEGFVANLPGQNSHITIQMHLKSYLAALGPAARARMRDLADHQVLLAGDEALRTLWIVLLVTLAIGCWVVSRRQYVLSA